MSIFSFGFMKEKRTLSFDHWRYRILHWCFNVKDANPRELEATGLPKFLYTHYCPLFHATNIILALAIPIWGIRKVCSLAMLVGSGFAFLGRSMASAFMSVPWGSLASLFKPHKRERTEPEFDLAKARKLEEKDLFEIMEARAKHHYLDFKLTEVWKSFKEDYSLLDKGKSRFRYLEWREVEGIFYKQMPKMVNALLKRDARKAALEARILWLIDVSMAVGKVAIWAGCFLGGAGLVWGLISIFAPVIEFIAWFFPVAWSSMVYGWEKVVQFFTDDGVLYIFGVLVQVLVVLGVMGTPIYLARNRLEKFACTCFDGIKQGVLKLSFLAFPFILLYKGFDWTVECALAGLGLAKNFITTFYEENCPGITLLIPEEKETA